MQQDQTDAQEVLGSQGNVGMYGQGQYDSEGKRDPHGPEAQRLKPDPAVNEKPVAQGNQGVTPNSPPKMQPPQQPTQNQ